VLNIKYKQTPSISRNMFEAMVGVSGVAADILGCDLDPCTVEAKRRANWPPRVHQTERGPD